MDFIGRRRRHLPAQPMCVQLLLLLLSHTYTATLLVSHLPHPAHASAPSVGGGECWLELEKSAFSQEYLDMFNPFSRPLPPLDPPLGPSDWPEGRMGREDHLQYHWRDCDYFAGGVHRYKIVNRTVFVLQNHDARGGMIHARAAIDQVGPVCPDISTT
jgi:hypothetical protein